MIGTDIFRTGLAHCFIPAAALLLHGCNTAPRGKPTPPAPQPMVVEQVVDWQRTALPEDIQRLGSLNQAWAEALEGAAKAGFKRSVAEEGKLLEPGAGLPRPAPAPGSYMCRLIQFGSTAARGRAFAASKASFCYVGVDDDGRLWLARQTGALRREGYLWEDTNRQRMIYLGTLAKGAKDAAPSYGVPERSRGAVFERIGPLRYRLVTPWPPGFKLEVMELTPAPLQRED